ncbi:hypothetical protein [Dongia sp.]|uniref:hypothetical protein n=1 Tax=Dongia sp. TaxID=1977262 RepID=UPI003751CFD6
MVDDDERNWKTQISDREADQRSGAFGRCALAGLVAILIAPLALFAVMAIEPVLLEGRLPHITVGELIGRFFQYYFMVLMFSLPVSIPCAIVFAIAAYWLRKAGRLNWLTSMVAGAAIGGLADALAALLIFKAQSLATPEPLLFFGATGAVTTLLAYGACLRRP